MYTVTYHDGKVFRGENYPRVLECMINSNAFTMWQESEDYMKDVAWRIGIREEKTVPIRTDSPENFFQDLLKHGYLRRMGLES